MVTLTALQRQNLRARAHALKPTVMIGAAGLTDAVLLEIGRAFKSHEVIKISVLSSDRHARKTMLEQICTQLNAAPVQHIGKILVIYQRQEEPLEKNPAQRPPLIKRGGKPLTKKQLGSR